LAGGVEVAHAGEGVEEEIMLQGTLRIEGNGGSQLRDGLGEAAVLLQPAAVEGVGTVVGGGESDGAGKVLLGVEGSCCVSLIG
jgi:hypothetical protein